MIATGMIGVELAFSASEYSVYCFDSPSTAQAFPGDFTGSYVRDNGDPSDIPQIIVGEGGTGVKISGEAPAVAGAPISGVAYVDGSCVFVYNAEAGEYQLSYVTAAEGISRPDNTFEYYLKDHLGSTRMVMVASGSGWEAQEATNYLAYGLPITVKQATGDKKAREKFTGKEYDEGEGTGLGYWGARYYDNLTGSWISTDPKEQDFNVYGYCAGNPVLKVDPNGELWGLIGAIAGAAIGGYAGGVASNGSFNWNDWDWSKTSTWTGVIGGRISGALTGYGIGSRADAAIKQANLDRLNQSPLYRSFSTNLDNQMMSQENALTLAAGPRSQINPIFGGNVISDADASLVRTHPVGWYAHSDFVHHWRYANGSPLYADLSKIDLSRVHFSDFPGGVGTI